MITCTPIAVFRQRLLNAAQSVLDYDHSEDRIVPGEIYMGSYIKPCGAPACVLGHYCAREDLQDDFSVRYRGIISRNANPNDNSLGFDSIEVRRHFDLRFDESHAIFGEYGCRNARHPEQVSEFIRDFVANKYPQWQ